MKLMLRRILCCVAVMAIYGHTAEAKPKNPVRQINWKKVVTAAYIVGLPAAMATWNTIETSKCRRRGPVDKCETRYGAWVGAQVADHVLSDLVLPIITYKVKHIEEENDEFKTWWFLPLASSGVNAYMAVNQRSKNHDQRCVFDKDHDVFVCVDKDPIPIGKD